MTAPPAGALEACLALLEKATRGRWSQDTGGDITMDDGTTLFTRELPGGDSDISFANANLVEAAVNFLRDHGPALLAALRLREWRPIAKGGSLPAVGEWVSLLTDTHAGPRPDLLFLSPDKPRFTVIPAQLRFVDEEGWPTWQRWELSSGSPCGRIEGDIAWQPLPAPPTADDLARVLEQTK